MEVDMFAIFYKREHKQVRSFNICFKQYQNFFGKVGLALLNILSGTWSPAVGRFWFLNQKVGVTVFTSGCLPATSRSQQLVFTWCWLLEGYLVPPLQFSLTLMFCLIARFHLLIHPEPYSWSWSCSYSFPVLIRSCHHSSLILYILCPAAFYLLPSLLIPVLAPPRLFLAPTPVLPCWSIFPILYMLCYSWFAR